MRSPARILPRSAEDRGETLVEIITAVAIMGIAFVSIVGGFFTSAVASDVHRKEATAGAVLRDAAEYVKAATYSSCTSTYSLSGFTSPSGFAASVTSVEYWVPDPANGTGLFSGTCGSDAGVQRVSLRVASSDVRAVETMQILKRTP